MVLRCLRWKITDGPTVSGGLKARKVIAWAGASAARAQAQVKGYICFRGLQGRNNPFLNRVGLGGAALTGRSRFMEILILGLRAGRSTPGCHMTGFQPWVGVRKPKLNSTLLQAYF